MHPDDGSKSLAKIIRSILEDAAFLVDPDEGRSLPRKEAPPASKNGQEERKAKRQKMYDTEQGNLNVRRRTDELEVETVRHGLCCRSLADYDNREGGGRRGQADISRPSILQHYIESCSPRLGCSRLAR